jgi:drug/metabolite transporter (DMT)-like permease
MFNEMIRCREQAGQERARPDNDIRIMTQRLAEEEKRVPAGLVLAAMGLAVLALAFSSIFITKLEQLQVAPIVIAFYRMAMATLILLPAAITMKAGEIRSLDGRQIAMLFAGGFFLAVHFGAWITSLKYIPISTSVVLVNSHPLFVVIASYIFLGERPSPLSIIGTFIGMVGMLVISREAISNVSIGSGDDALLGNALAVLGALAVVGYFIVGRKARSRLSLLGYVTPLYGVCSAMLLLWTLSTGAPLYPYSATVWAYFAALAIVPTILGHTVFNWAIKHVRPSAISLAFLGEPVVASVLAFLFFSQAPPASTFIGGGLVLAGVYLATYAGRTK